jgi:hypothetical protein
MTAAETIEVCRADTGQTGLDYFGARYFSAAQGRWELKGELKGADAFSGKPGLHGLRASRPKPSCTNILSRVWYPTPLREAISRAFVMSGSGNRSAI